MLSGRGFFLRRFVTGAGLRVRASLAAYLGSSMVYRDALNGVYGFGGIYAVGVLGWTITQVGVFGVVGAISAAVIDPSFTRAP